MLFVIYISQSRSLSLKVLAIWNLIKMKIEDEIKSDPNIIYVKDDESDGGSIVDFTGGCKSVGELILQKLELGENRVAFVSEIF